MFLLTFLYKCNRYCTECLKKQNKIKTLAEEKNPLHNIKIVENVSHAKDLNKSYAKSVQELPNIKNLTSTKSHYGYFLSSKIR